MENTVLSHKVTYPTQPSAEGFFYETEEEASQQILTKRYDNGSIIKQVKLPRCGKLAVVRSLKAKESTEVSRLMAEKAEKFGMATITVATTFDGNKMTMEDVEDLPMKDFQLLLVMCGELNF